MTETITDDLTDIDVTGVPRCTVRQCGKPATHRAIWWCGCMDLICARHHAQAMKRLSIVTEGCRCSYCAATRRLRAPLSAFVRIEPL